MKLVMFEKSIGSSAPPLQERGQGGVLLGEQVWELAAVCRWAGGPVCRTVAEFVALEPALRQSLIRRVSELPAAGLESLPLALLQLRAPLSLPPSLRDFYAFEQHVKTARLNRGREMIAEWYDFPVFYFSNPRAISGPHDPIPYPRKSRALDFELELACVIGQAGRNIPAEEASLYIAGYTIMNDWSARDLQAAEMKMQLGPAKGKDFATSLGPWLVTPDELEAQRVGQGAAERYDLTMRAQLNGVQISLGNAKDLYFSFPQMIERASLNAWLVPGDVIGSGTVGSGCLLEQGDKRARYLQPGDEIELEIDKLGILSNKVVASEV